MNKAVVFPTPSFLRGELFGRNRLYAFPVVPEPPVADEFVILDSGAFGLSQRGGHMTEEYMRKLSAHYVEHGGGNDFPILAVAPDAYPNSYKSMKQWDTWHELGLCPVCPVIQFDNKRITAYSVLKQCQFYAQYRPKVVFVSNPGMTADVAQQNNIVPIIEFIWSELKPRWIHVLGAGWNTDDAKKWLRIRHVNSIDSIAYYTDAQAGLKWRNTGASKEMSEDDEVQISLYNANILESL